MGFVDPKQAYLTTRATSSIQDATPHKLISLLFDACHENLSVARGAMERGDVKLKANAIKKTMDIIVRLQGILDFQRGGAVAVSLDDVYTKCTRQLSLANALNDLDMLQDVYAAIEELKLGWHQIEKMDQT
jgi:flagellar protein FliS